MTAAERARLHANIMGVYRTSLSERYDAEDPSSTLSDNEILQVYALRSPYTMVRFSRLRLSVRLLCKAPIEVLVLIYAARNDAKSWLRALQDDIRWLGKCDPKAVFTDSEWFTFCRASPKAARTLIRKICDSDGARSLTLGEVKPAVRRLELCFSCPCGWTGKSVQAFWQHKRLAHGEHSPAQHYIDSTNTCLCCNLAFSSRELVRNHLVRSQFCFLNVLLRVPPLSMEELTAAKEHENALIRSRIRSGLPAHHAKDPPRRKLGPLWPLITLQGESIDIFNKRHPHGPSGRRYLAEDA